MISSAISGNGCRLVLCRLINPGGSGINRRSNLNARRPDAQTRPIDAMGSLPWLVSGHRISPRFALVRGRRGDSDGEAKLQLWLGTPFRKRLLDAPFSLSVDLPQRLCAARIVLWCSYARNHKPMHH